MERASFPLEVAAVWVLLAVVAVEILVTYARLPPEELYHVSGSGIAGGASRALVFVNWPVALVAIPILVVLAVRLATRAATVVAVVGIVFSAAIFWPGMVKESDLDARSENAIAAVGVLLALSLTVVGAHRLGRPTWAARRPGDALGLVVAVVVVGLSIPWIAADLGLSFNGVPVLGSIYQSGELRSQPGQAALHPAVHHGHHHGMSGALLVLSALLLWRLLGSLSAGLSRRLLAAYLALMLCYGAGNVANDAWLEQVVKRGWTDWEIANVTTPKISVTWGVIVLVAAALWAVAVWRDRRSGLASPRAEVV